MYLTSTKSSFDLVQPLEEFCKQINADSARSLHKMPKGSRFVYIAKDSENRMGSCLFLLKFRLVRELICGVNDELAFHISHNLGLDVVPLTKVLNPEEIKKFKRFFAKGSTIRSQLKKIKNQILELVKPPFTHQVVIQKFVPRYDIVDYSTLYEELDYDHLQRSIIFNVLTGRADGDEGNSIINTAMKCMEVDNEFLGGEESNSWLLSKFSHLTLSESNVKLITEANESLIQEIFNKVVTEHGITLDDLNNSKLEGIHCRIDSNFKILRESIKPGLSVSELPDAAKP